VRPGAIDFALTGLAPSRLVARADEFQTTKTIVIVTIIVIFVILVISVIAAVFCAVVPCLMHKKKRERQKRNRDLSAFNTDHRYRPVDHIELEHGGVQELPAENNFGGGGRKAELQGEFSEIPRVQQLDGFVAPPKPTAQPVELPSNTPYKYDHHR
jgi:hypothetical protein